MNNKSLFNYALRYGLLAGLLSCIFLFLAFASYNEAESVISTIKYFILLAIIVLVHFEFKKARDGFLSYKEGLALGILLSVSGGGVVSFFIYIYQEFIDPDILVRMANQIRKRFEEAGITDENQIDQMTDMFMNFSSGYVSLLINYSSYVFIGSVFALLVSIFTKKVRPTL